MGTEILHKMSGMRGMRNDKGFTLTELIVVMAVFAVVMMMVSVSFENIIKKSGQQRRSATTQIEGVVGLEMLRTDISHAGFALPWEFQITPTAAFQEVSASPATGLGIDATSFNEAVNVAPWAVRGGTRTGGSFEGSHYLVLKSALLALHTGSTGRWGFINYSGSGQSNVRRLSDPATDTNVRQGTDQLISIRDGFDADGDQFKRLLMRDVSSTGFYYKLPADNKYIPPDPAFRPANASQTVYSYALGDGSALRMPYNRADYYVYRGSAVPTSCNPSTGVLYKAVAAQSGSNSYAGIYPLLNCVGDMQVILGLGDGTTVLNFVPPDAASYTGLSAQQAREQLKEVRVYILAHEGKKDANYQYPEAEIRVGEAGLGGRVWDSTAMASTFGADWRNYRWKVYSIMVQLKNLGGA